MKAAPFAYVRPGRLDDVLGELAGGDGKVLAGGQSLVPVLAMRLGRPGTLVDITAVPELTTTDPVDVMVIESGVLFLTVEVWTGVVRLVVMSSAWAGTAIARRAVEASSVVRIWVLVSDRIDPHDGARAAQPWRCGKFIFRSWRRYRGGSCAAGAG